MSWFKRVSRRSLWECLVHDYNIILNDPEVEVIIEVMGGLKPSYDFVKSA